MPDLAYGMLSAAEANPFLRALLQSGQLFGSPAEAGSLGISRKALAKVQEEMAAKLKEHGLKTSDVTVRSPLRIQAPGIYQSPPAIVEQARQRLAPESPMLNRLFGVTRGDLRDIALSRKGDIEPQNIRGMTWRESEHIPEPVQSIMTQPNAQRYGDVLYLAQKDPELAKSVGWYVMDPAYARLEQLMGPYRAPPQYNYLNTMHGPFSASSPVDWELMRGSAAAMMAQRGEWPAFVKYGGKPTESRARMRNLPEELANMPGMMAHSTAHTPALTRWLQGQGLEFGTAKVPPYIGGTGVPQTGFQTGYPVIDAHMGKGLGYYDTRTAKAGSMQPRETDPIARWFSRDISRPVGLEPLYGQSLGWTVFGPQTGVATLIGAPKLEIAADLIARRAAREGLNPEAVRDAWLMSQGAIGAGGPLLPGLSEIARWPAPQETGR